MQLEMRILYPRTKLLFSGLEKWFGALPKIIWIKTNANVRNMWNWKETRDFKLQLQQQIAGILTTNFHFAKYILWENIHMGRKPWYTREKTKKTYW